MAKTLTFQHLLQMLHHLIANLPMASCIQKIRRLLQTLLVAQLVQTVLVHVFLVLQLLHVSDGHLDDFRLFDPSASFALILRRYQTRQIRQAGVHAIASSFLDDAMREWILLFGVWR